jgi:Mg2+ and Co2+ transporter CorA
LAKETGRDFVSHLIHLRRRIADLRRLLTSHRTVFAALVRPDFGSIAAPDQGEHFRALNDRLDRAIDSIENAREMVIGSFELYMTKTAQNTNEVVKGLSLVIAIFGLVGGIAAIMGMNFQLQFFKTGATGFFIVIGIMTLLVICVLLFAKHRRWY